MVCLKCSRSEEKAHFWWHNSLSESKPKYHQLHKILKHSFYFHLNTVNLCRELSRNDGFPLRWTLSVFTALKHRLHLCRWCARTDLFNPGGVVQVSEIWVGSDQDSQVHDNTNMSNQKTNKPAVHQTNSRWCKEATAELTTLIKKLN